MRSAPNVSRNRDDQSLGSGRPIRGNGHFVKARLYQPLTTNHDLLVDFRK